MLTQGFSWLGSSSTEGSLKPAGEQWLSYTGCNWEANERSSTLAQLQTSKAIRVLPSVWRYKTSFNTLAAVRSNSNINHSWPLYKAGVGGAVKNLSITYRCVCACQLLSCARLCDCMDCSPPGSSVHEILQARTLEWVAISFSRGSSRRKDPTQVSSTAGRFFTIWRHQGSPTYGWPSLSEIGHLRIQQPQMVPYCNIYYWKNSAC